MKIIRTVRGDILPEQLGVTLVHEHTVFDEKRMLLGLLRSVPGMVSGAKAYDHGLDIQRETKRRKEDIDHAGI